MRTIFVIAAVVATAFTMYVQSAYNRMAFGSDMSNSYMLLITFGLVWVLFVLMTGDPQTPLRSYETEHSIAVVQAKSNFSLWSSHLSAIVISVFCAYPYFISDVLRALHAYRWPLLALLLSAIAAIVTAAKVQKSRDYAFWQMAPVLWDQPHQSLLNVFYLIAIAAAFNFTGNLYADYHIHEILWTWPNMMPTYDSAVWLYEVFVAAVFYGGRIRIWTFLAIPLLCAYGTVSNLYYAHTYRNRNSFEGQEYIMRDVKPQAQP